MKNDRLNSSCWLSVVGCRRNTKGLSSSYLPTLALAITLTLLVTPLLFAQQRWERIYGGTDSDGGRSVRQTSDGGYVVTGETWSFGAGGYDVYLIKTNSSGDTLWTKTYGGTSDDYGNSVQQTQDGGYIVAGLTGSYGAGINDFYLIKTNANGDTLWTRTYGGRNDDYGESVRQTSDGGYVVAGYTQSFGNDLQVYLVKTNASGDTLWTRTYGGADYDWGTSVQQTSDGGYIVAGCTGSYGDTLGDVYLIKTNSSGDTLWTRTYGGADGDDGSSVQQTSDGGYIVAGLTGSFGAGINDFYLIKTNSTGDTLWTRTYGGTNEDHGHFVQQTSDGGYIFAGFTYISGPANWDVYLVKTNASGDPSWTRNYGGTSADFSESVQQTSDGGYIVAGITSSFGYGPDVYLIKTDANGNVGVETAEDRGQRLEVRIKPKPNPFTSFASVPGQEKETFELYDIAGRKVGTYRGDRIGANLPAGVYFLRPTEQGAKSLRIVKIK